MLARLQAPAAFILLLLATASPAQDADKTWTDEAELSFVQTGGNTDVLTLAIRNLLKVKLSDTLLASWRASALYGRSEGVTNAERYGTELRLDYLFSTRLYAAADAGWLRDRFAGLATKYTVGPSLGYKILVGPGHFLTAEGGAAWVRERYLDRTESDFASARARAIYEYAFTERNRFSQTAEYLVDLGEAANYDLRSVTAMQTAINRYLSLKGSYEVRYDNQPVPASLKKTDTTLSLALVVTFR